jgi:hypothetical protein
LIGEETEAAKSSQQTSALVAQSEPQQLDQPGQTGWGQLIRRRFQQADWTRVFAFIGAIGVIVQGFLTTRQVGLAARQVAAVEQNLPRAWFFPTLDPNEIRFLAIQDDPAGLSKKGFQFSILLTVHNYGKIPGQIVSLSANAYVVEAGEIGPSPLGSDGLASSGYRTFSGNMGAFSTEIIAADGGAYSGWLSFPFRDMKYVPSGFGNFRAWLLVQIAYRDPLGELRETSNFIDLFHPPPRIISDPRFTYWR